ncbi:hypothetical protein [Enterococcus faecium]|uniref:hypothetical protein n=1 Tax=Enterococcus faecium TaxID=1352 RepID=UPI002953A817|nr:hypothetical protein [Enterococcus faecium]MDV7831619.1 hypothetical protein [Enterococcus faecium]
MEMFLALFTVFAFFALIINLTILLFKRIRRNDTTRQKKIIVYNFALFSGAIIIVTIISMIIPKESNTSSANNSTTISNTSESSEAAELSQEYIKSSSDIEEENLKKGTLADEIKNELYELDLTEDEMNDIIFAHNTFVPDTAQSYQINPYLGISGLYEADMSDFDVAWTQVNIYGFVRFSYISDDWLFAKDIEIKTDNNKYSINPSYNDWERDNSSDSTWEWYNAPLNEYTVDMYNDMANSSQTLIRINGDTYYDDRYLTSEEISALKQILSIYNKYLELQALI